jgi:hypothetical protein
MNDLNDSNVWNENADAIDRGAMPNFVELNHYRILTRGRRLD